MQIALRSPGLEDYRENLRSADGVPQRSRERTSGGGLLRGPALIERRRLGGNFVGL